MAYTSDGFRTPFNKFFTILRDKAIISKKDYHFFDETLSNVSNDISEIDTNVTALDTRVTDLENATPVVENYKLVCKISQSGTNAPSIQIIENTFPDTVVNVTATRSDVGDYLVTIDSTVKSWADFSTVCYFNSQIGPFQAPPQTDQYHINHYSTGSGPNFYTNFRVRTYNITGAALADAKMSQHTFTIIVAA